MDMLCIAASHDPIGYVSVAGRGLSETDIARMTGGSESEALALLGELERNGVFSRDRKGTIYSRRMVSDAKKAAVAKKIGKLGGNPSLCKNNGNSTADKGTDKGEVNPHKPLASSPVEESSSVEDKSSTGAEAPRVALSVVGKDSAPQSADPKPPWWPKVDRYKRLWPDVATDKLAFQLGRWIFGEKGGGVIGKSARATRNDWRWIIEFLLLADGMGDPKNWFMAKLRDAERDMIADPPYRLYPENIYRER